jgi:hypothetical protein
MLHRTWQARCRSADMEGHVTVSAPPWMMSTRWRSECRRPLMSSVAEIMAMALPAQTSTQTDRQTYIQIDRLIEQTLVVTHRTAALVIHTACICGIACHAEARKSPI